MKKLFVVGDVHGCFHTFKQLLQEHWQPQKELLVQVGDLINKGNYSPQTVAYARKLQREHGAIFLRGNHEHAAILHQDGHYWQTWYESFVLPTQKQYDATYYDYEKDVEWFKTHPLFWSNDHVFISHAGISNASLNHLDLEDKHCILWNRAEIKNIGKLQIIGHTPRRDGKPFYDAEQKYCNVDTGSFLGLALSAVRLDENGDNLEFVQVFTHEKDFL